MSNVIDFYLWKAERRARLGTVPAMASKRRARRDQRGKEADPLTTGTVKTMFNAQLLRSLAELE